MSYFPAFFDLSQRPCVVIGAGRVGRRKLQRLLHCRAHPLTVVEPYPDPDLIRELEGHPDVFLLRREFDPGDIQDAFLVVASTSDAQLNASIGRLCREKDILCNVVDEPQLCSLIWPSLITRGDLGIAVTTSGASPALARRIRKDLEAEFGPEYALWLDLLKMLRPGIIARRGPQGDNAAVFRTLTQEDIYQAISKKDGPQLLALLEERLPRDLHPFAREVLHELEFSL
ncbi:MAG: bifunctional precorrin-2 dehydrogenase/sirohydrochlorin ferrochelatase [Desulfovermiculus sp.]